MKFNNRNVLIHENVNLGSNVKIGDNTTIYPNVSIGDNTIIANNCVIGEPSNEYYFNQAYSQEATIIGNNCLIRSHALIYSGSRFGDNFQTGHRVTIREKTKIANHVSVGTNSDIQGYCNIGNYCRFHSFVNIGQMSTIEDYVFIYPYAVLTNDPFPPSEKLKGVIIKKFTQISSHAVIIGGVIIGEHCLIGANTTVNKDIPDNSLVVTEGVKIIPNLSKMPFFTEDNKRKYPWPVNYKRGMPWEKYEYDEWIKENE
jgi:UDP-3-O-[3-hydroxymyristoyl] glucosamine N-acyltransferase